MPATPAPSDPWRAFDRLALLGAVAIGLGLWAAVALLDPYETGRTPFPRRPRPVSDDIYAAVLSRARDPAFDAAVLGNSHVQLLRPERLDGDTGLAFVSLILQGTGPADTLDTLRVYLAGRTRPPRAVVLSIDPQWCVAGPGRSEHFPRWLWGRDLLPYLRNLASGRALELALHRLLPFGRGDKAAFRRDGFSSYEPAFAARERTDPGATRRELDRPKRNPVNTSGRFPLLDGLGAALGRLPAETAAVLVRTPVYRTALPPEGSPEAETARACGEAVRAVAAARPRTALVDEYGRHSDDPAAFFDHDHFRDDLAKVIESDVAEALARMGTAPRS